MIQLDDPCNNRNINISVIIPVYKAEKFIETCVRSLMEQTLADIEYVFVNDYTPDKSMEILHDVISEYPDRQAQVKVISHSCNKGVATTRNTGLKNAGGVYIGWVDPDDWIEKNMYEELFLTAKQTNADIAWCDYFVNTEEEKVISQQSVETPEALLDAVIRERLMGTLCNRLIKRELFVKHEICFLDGVNMAEDKSVLLKTIGVSSIVRHIPVAYYHYRMHSNSATTREDYVSRQYDHIINSLDAVTFLSRSCRERITDENMIIYKLLAKRLYLFSFHLTDFRAWARTFPETNRDIFQCPHTKLRYKIVGWMAAKHSWWFVSMWLKIKTVLLAR